MKRRRTRIIIGCVLGTLLWRAVAAFCAVGLFFHFFFARYDTLCPTDLNAADLRSPSIAVSFDANGTALSGRLIGSGRKGVIVIVHGLLSGMDAHFAEADYFAEHGYTVLTYDATGTRTSDGRSRSSVSLARDDLNAALDYLETTALRDLPVYLYGHSSGGYAVATELTRADAAVAICAFNDPIDTMCRTARRYVSFFAELQRPYLILWNRIEAGSDANERATDCLNATTVPILIVGASKDDTIPDADSLYLLSEAITDPNASYLLREGGHSDVWLAPDALRYREAVQDAAPEEIDRLRYNAVDPAFLDAVMAFFDAAK